MNELENQFGRRLDQSIDIDDRHTPLLKRILLYERQHLAEKHEEIRLKTTSAEIRDALEAQSEPVRRLMSEEWFQNTRPSRLPRLTDFLTPRDTYQVMPAAPDLQALTMTTSSDTPVPPRAFYQRYVVVGLRAGFVT